MNADFWDDGKWSCGRCGAAGLPAVSYGADYARACLRQHQRTKKCQGLQIGRVGRPSGSKDDDGEDTPADRKNRAVPRLAFTPEAKLEVKDAALCECGHRETIHGKDGCCQWVADAFCPCRKVASAFGGVSK